MTKIHSYHQNWAHETVNQAVDELIEARENGTEFPLGAELLAIAECEVGVIMFVVASREYPLASEINEFRGLPRGAKEAVVLGLLARA